MTDDPLVLGPMLRHVDETSASIWVETAAAATVAVHAGDRSWQARTFTVHGHHYAIVVARDLEPGSELAYSVAVDDERVWPRPAADGETYPPSVIRTLHPDRRLRLMFGSCRTSVAHDAEANRTHGVDALRALAIRMMRTDQWPDLFYFVGDQVYADETTEAMREFIGARRDIDQPPGTELKDFEEYAHLYRLAWSDPANRWLLSTLSTAMIFDDHDIRDDWNSSRAWKQRMRATPWWHDRLIGGLASYWVYQHLGNLSPAERSQDELWRLVESADGPDEVDLSVEVDRLAARVDDRPESYRWSFSRDVAGCRLIMLDTRAARMLEPGHREMIDQDELAWLRSVMTGDCRELLVATSLPFLLPPGLHHLEAWDEAIADGAWGKRWARFGEWLRQTVDLEHWAAFQRSFQQVARLALEVADGRHGAPPRTVTFLSGDVHHSYLSEVRGRRRGARVLQAVCSPIRNPLPRIMRFATAVLAYGVAGVVGAVVARSARVPRAPMRWRRLHGPWYDNCVATVEDRDDALVLRWETGVVDGADGLPHLELVREVRISR